MVGNYRGHRVGDKRLIPASVAADSVLDHILFALKHEGRQSGVLSFLLRHVPAAERWTQKCAPCPATVLLVWVACLSLGHYTQGACRTHLK